MRGVVSQLQMLERELGDETPESAREAFELAMKAARRQREHVEALLEYEEATDQAALDPETVGLTGPVEASDVALAISQAIVRRRGGEIAFEADEAGSGFRSASSSDPPEAPRADP